MLPKAARFGQDNLRLIVVYLSYVELPRKALA